MIAILKHVWSRLVATKNMIPPMVRQAIWSIVLLAMGVSDIAGGHLIRGPYFFFMLGLDLQQFLGGRDLDKAYAILDQWSAISDRYRVELQKQHETIMALLRGDGE